MYTSLFTDSKYANIINSKKEQSKECVFVNSALKRQSHEKYTPTDCFFGDFAHCVIYHIHSFHFIITID